MRRFQRVILGAFMTLALIVIERRVLKAVRKRGDKEPQPADGLSLAPEK